MRRISIDFNKNNLNEKIQNTKEIFCKEMNFEYEFDLSKLNMIDASKAVLLLSAELMKKNTKSKINCLVKDRDVLNIISPRKLKNTFLSVTFEGGKKILYNNNVNKRKRYN